MNKSLIPFGMLFQEQASEVVEDMTDPHYDPLEGISYIYDPSGQRIAYVEWSHFYLATKTGDNTKTIIDRSDTDPADD